jgi:hypothetical protein
MLYWRRAKYAVKSAYCVSRKLVPSVSKFTIFGPPLLVVITQSIRFRGLFGTTPFDTDRAWHRLFHERSRQCGLPWSPAYSKLFPRHTQAHSGGSELVVSLLAAPSHDGALFASEDSLASAELGDSFRSPAHRQHTLVWTRSPSMR